MAVKERLNSLVRTTYKPKQDNVIKLKIYLNKIKNES